MGFNSVEAKSNNSFARNILSLGFPLAFFGVIFGIHELTKLNFRHEFSNSNQQAIVLNHPALKREFDSLVFFEKLNSECKLGKGVVSTGFGHKEYSLVDFKNGTRKVNVSFFNSDKIASLSFIDHEPFYVYSKGDELDLTIFDYQKNLETAPLCGIGFSFATFPQTSGERAEFLKAQQDPLSVFDAIFESFNKQQSELPCLQ